MPEFDLQVNKLKWLTPYLLTFFSTVLGVYLGFWISEKQNILYKQQQKELALENILNEFNNNKKELQASLESFSLWKKSRDRLIYNKKSKNYGLLRSQYLEDTSILKVFTIEDTVVLEVDTIYIGQPYLNFDLSDFSAIAYETSKSIQILSEFDFDCLYNIESIYNNQVAIQDENRNLLQAIYSKDLEKIELIVDVSIQFYELLLTKYQQIPQLTENCF